MAAEHFFRMGNLERARALAREAARAAPENEELRRMVRFFEGRCRGPEQVISFQGPSMTIRSRDPVLKTSRRLS